MLAPVPGSGPHLRCPTLIGRADELGGALDGLASAASGRGVVLAFVGEPGIGKTRLVSELVHGARQRDMLVLTGRSTAETSDVALRMWIEAFAAPSRTMARPSDPSLVAYGGVLGLLVPSWRDPGWQAPAEPVIVLAEAVVRTLALLAERQPLLVVLEDAHWADSASIEVLDYVARHAGELAMAMVVTMRSEGKGPALGRSLGQIGAGVHRLDRLVPNVAALMAKTCWPALADADVASLVAAGGGLPLAIEELAWRAAGQAPSTRFADSVLARLDRAGQTTQRAVMAAALLGEVVWWDIIGVALGLDADAEAAAAAQAEELDLIVPDGQEHRFRHALTRQAVVASIDAPTARFLRVAVAEALLIARGPSHERDLVAADLLERSSHAVAALTLLRSSSERSLAAGEVSDARASCAQAFRIAERLQGSSSLSDGGRLVQLELRCGRPADARVLASALLGRAEGVDRAAASSLRMDLARACAAVGDWAEAERHLAVVRAQDDVVNSAELSLLEAECALGAGRPGQRAAVEHQARRAVALAEASGRMGLTCDAYLLAGRVARLRDLNDAVALLERALELAEEHKLHWQRVAVLDELGTAEMLRDADSERLERARAEAVRLGAFGSAISAGVNLASAYVMTGRHQRCADLAAEVEVQASRLGLVPLEAACCFLRGAAAVFSGEQAAGDRLLHRALVLGERDADLVAGVWAIGRGVGALLIGDVPQARLAFGRSRDHAPERHARILDAALGPSMLLDAVDGLVSAADVEAAFGEEVTGARWSSLWMGAALGAALVKEGRLDDALVAHATALAAADRYPLFGAVVRRIVAPVLAGAGAQDRAIGDLRDAEATFEHLGLSGAATDVRAVLVSLGQRAPRRRGTDARVPADLLRIGVTAREAEVLELLCNRLTNRQIAERLYLSPKTVEKHVASLALKLGAGDRHELSALARSRFGR